MTQEEKGLLLKDLCGRLPYGVVCIGITYDLDDDGEKYIDVKVKSTLTEIHNYNLETASVRLGLISSCRLETVKPFLRPIDSITKEEKEELKQLDYEYLEEWTNAPTPIDKWKLDAKVTYKRSVFYNSHYLDWNGLIDKGLAIAVTEENNPYKE